MGAKTKIEWADATWGPIRGCSRVSAGCVHCYAETMAARFSGPGQPYDGLIRDRKWSGVVRLIPERLEDPIRWQKPRRIFVNSMSDLFHEELTDATIDRVFDVMERAPRHTFQVLTKRPHRSLSYTARRYVRGPAHVWIGTSIEDQKACGERLESIRDTRASGGSRARTPSPPGDCRARRPAGPRGTSATGAPPTAGTPAAAARSP